MIIYFLGILVLSCLFLKISRAGPTEFRVLEFVPDGLETDDISFATLIDHTPPAPLPDVFTICWRTKTSFARYTSAGADYLSIPLKPGENFMAFTQRNNATHTRILGKYFI